ncbi:hypothetical protein WA588_004766 [Blastocystis sp. NMH]
MSDWTSDNMDPAGRGRGGGIDPFADSDGYAFLGIGSGRGGGIDPFEEETKRSTAKADASKTEWICSKCKNKNWSDQTECSICHTPYKPKGLKKKSVENAVENDWKCPTCGNVNWGTQKSCTICGTKMNGEEGLPKESAATPSRESDDDDMYDAFGRKKKRYRHGKTEDSQVDMSIIRQSLKATEESTKKGTEQSTDEFSQSFAKSLPQPITLPFS